MKIKKETLLLAKLALQADVDISIKTLEQAIQNIFNPTTTQTLPKIIRRYQLPEILGISLREVDRLIHPVKIKNKIVKAAQIPTIRIGKKAIGVLEEDLTEFINSRRVVEE